jgi:hypothetical protein
MVSILTFLRDVSMEGAAQILINLYRDPGLAARGEGIGAIPFQKSGMWHSPCSLVAWAALFGF